MTGFNEIRKNIIGIDSSIETPFGKKKLVYTDWTASGRLYHPVEERLANTFGELVGNTHSESTATGKTMTYAYFTAQEIIKKHVNASPKDIIITTGAGMTSAVNKLQRILGLKIHERYKKLIHLPENDRPIVFVTHMEHHSNQTSWIETIADVVVINPTEEGYIDFNHFAELLEQFKHRKIKIGAFTSCSNVTGIHTAYHELAKLIHAYNGYCFIDCAASAPYMPINMHPEDENARLDAICFSPHKFLGGPGSAGVLIMNSELYANKIPDYVGGGVVDWTNPWGEHKFIEDIEAREDAGTPGFLQTIKAALAIELKNEMGTDNIKSREDEILDIAFPGFYKIPRLHILADNLKNRLSTISFYADNVRYNLMVKVLNDYYGIQSRGGCSCAGTYGHYLLNVDREKSKQITDKINSGDNSEKPGWVRVSFHPTNTDEEVHYVINAIKEITENSGEWEKKYTYSSKTNEFYFKDSNDSAEKEKIRSWFRLS